MREVERIWSESRSLIEKAKQSPDRDRAQTSAAPPETSESSAAESPGQGSTPAAGAQKAANSDVKFACLYCGQHLICDHQMAGTKISCPNCHRELAVPANLTQPARRRFGIDLNDPVEAAVLRRILLSKEGPKVLFEKRSFQEEIESEMPWWLAAGAFSGTLVGIWATQYPKVSLLRDLVGRELWAGSSFLEHVAAGILLGLFGGLVLCFLVRPVAALLRWIAGPHADAPPARFGLGFGKYIGAALGALFGAMFSIGSHGTILRRGIVFLFVPSGERGFLGGGILGTLAVGLACVILARLRPRIRHQEPSA